MINTSTLTRQLARPLETPGPDALIASHAKCPTDQPPPPVPAQDWAHTSAGGTSDLHAGVGAELWPRRVLRERIGEAEIMTSCEVATVGPRAVARLLAEGSARFTSWMTIGEAPLAEKDVDARGVTSFGRSETRAAQLALSAAVLRDGALKARTSRNPLDWALVGGVTSLLTRFESGRWRECFYAEANQWKLNARSESWVLLDPEPRREGYRNGVDPTLVFESLGAIRDIREITSGVEVGGVATTRLQMQTDLTQIADRLEGFLRLGDNRRRARRWMNTAPSTLWLDDTGLTRRISYRAAAGKRKRTVLADHRVVRLRHRGRPSRAW